MVSKARFAKYLGVGCACLLGCQQEPTSNEAENITNPQLMAPGGTTTPAPGTMAVPTAGTNAPASDAAVVASEPGLHMVGDQAILRTEEFTVPAGQETYLCWPTAVPEGFKVQAYESDAAAVVHHFLLVRTTRMEPDGIAECDATFRNGWMPLFAAGAGKSELRFPPDVVQGIGAGQRLLVQLHLLNPSTQPVTTSAQVVMSLAASTTTKSVQLNVIGNTDIELPPGQASQVVGECETANTTRLVGFFPHMHLLGTALTLELGPSPESMEVAYKRDPYDFQVQTIDSMDMVIDAGTHARVTCEYNNTRQETITFGESSLDEMCFLIMFGVGGGIGNCIHGTAELVKN